MHLRTCQAVFEKTLLRTGAAFDATLVTLAARNADTVHADTAYAATRKADQRRWNPIPDAAVAVGRQCLQRVGDVSRLPAYDWPFLLRLAVGVNDDTLVSRLVRWQLAKALATPGTTVRDRAGILDSAIIRLLRNQWIDTGVHRTPAHDTLAREFAAWLDTLHPAGPVLTTRLHIYNQFNDRPEFGNSADVGVLKAEREFALGELQLVQSVPLSEVPTEDQGAVQSTLVGAHYWLARLAYLLTPTHENLTKLVAARDAGLHLKPGTFFSLIGHSMPRLDGDYWFNLPSKGTSTIPAPGMISLVAFIDLQEGKTLAEDRIWDEAAKLRHIHTRFPKLQIVIVTMTRGHFLDKDYRQNVAQEAEQMNRYITEQLRIPAIICVMQTKYHTDPGGTAVPLASPALDRFHLDPRFYNGRELLIDAEGWVVQDATVLDDLRFAQRLFAQ